MRCDYACNSPEHTLARRQFLGQMAAGAGMLGSLSYLAQPAVSAELSQQQKRVLVVNMHGGLSQLESWDPKPGTNTGGPFRAIPTSVPGMHICELLPLTAKVTNHLAIVRSVNTKENDHGKGRYMMMHGRKQTPAADYPVLGATTAKCLTSEASTLPGHIIITAGGGGGRGNDSAYLGPKYAGMHLGNGNPPQNSARPDGVTAESDAARQQFRKLVDSQFLSRRRTAKTEAYTFSYEAAEELMRQREIFDVTKESDADHERYGKHDLGRHCLLARRLLENNIAYVEVSHSNYDTHNENFNFHLEQLGEFDRPFSTLISDLADRGLLQSTLVVVLSEFGRTPNINHLVGRDHWGTAWSVLLGGAKVHPGAIIGKTNENGTQVTDREVDHSHLFHTYLQAVGVQTSKSFDIDGRQIPIADPAVGAIHELIA